MLNSEPLTVKTRRRDPDRLVAVQPDVLSGAEHALGNVLQRIHHVARNSRETLGPQSERLQAVLEELERLLELVFDYVSPIDLEISPVSAGRIADSLAANVRAHASYEVGVGAVPAMQIALDRRLLVRSFTLLTSALAWKWRCSSAASIEVVHDGESERLEFIVRARVSGDEDRVPNDHDDLAIAVARRLIELQGGELSTDSGGAHFECRICLPAPRPADERA